MLIVSNFRILVTDNNNRAKAQPSPRKRLLLEGKKMSYQIKTIQKLTGLPISECAEIERNIFVDWSEDSYATIKQAIQDYQNMDALEAKMAALGL